jgi:ketosteroid isomerase-like protein
MGTSTIRGVFDRSTDAFNRHDVGEFMSYCTDDVTCTAPGVGRIQGKEAVAAFYQSWLEGFPDARVEVREALAIDDGIVEEGTFSGTHTGVLRSPNGDLPPTRKLVSERYAQVVRMRGERISSFDLFYDRLALLEQLGMVESTRESKAQPGDATDMYSGAY